MALRKKTHTVVIGTDLDVNKVQVVTLTSWGAGDSFKLSYNGSATAAFVQGTNGAAADIQAALRTLTGDASLTVTGTDDAGPFTVTFTTTPVDILTVTNATGCTGAVTVNLGNDTIALKPTTGPYLIRRVITTHTPAASSTPTYEVKESGPGTAELADESPADVTLTVPAPVDGIVVSGLAFDDEDELEVVVYYESRGDYRF